MFEQISSGKEAKKLFFRHILFVKIHYSGYKKAVFWIRIRSDPDHLARIRIRIVTEKTEI